MRWLKIADNSIDYSLGNTTKQALWLPTSREAKYKAKQAVDSFFVRTGDVIQAGVVFAGERLALAVPAFAAVNLVLVGLWIGVVVLLNRQLRARAAKAGRVGAVGAHSTQWSTSRTIDQRGVTSVFHAAEDPVVVELRDRAVLPLQLDPRVHEPGE